MLYGGAPPGLVRFHERTSEIFNRIAQICALYEDLKIEFSSLENFGEDLKRDGEVKKTFEVFYYIRKSTASLVEFRGGLLPRMKVVEE